MGFTLRQLEIFEKVAATEHITKAGELLFISQSAVSMAISELEKETGGPLFERRGRKLLINERGRVLLTQARQILKLINFTNEMMKDTSANPMGILKVGASTTIGNYLLPILIGDFKKEYPHIEVPLYIGNTQQIEKGVDSGELDLGLVEGPSHIQTLKNIPWRDDELVVICGSEHPWARRQQASVPMLARASWIIREKGSGTREVFESAMIKKVKNFNICLELGHTEAIKKAVEAGLGISCLSRLTVQRELEHKWLVEIKNPLDLRRPLSILMHKDKFITKLLNSFLALLQKSS